MREAVRQARAGLDPAWIREASLQIQRAALELPEIEAARRIGLYLAQPREVGTELIIETARARGQLLALPAWNPERNSYGMADWLVGTDLHPGLYGIQEPAAPVWVSEVDVMIIPCVAFDPQGGRLGHGGGHFDRLLENFRGLKVCLAFEVQKMAAIPRETHDVRVDVVITERAVYAG